MVEFWRVLGLRSLRVFREVDGLGCRSNLLGFAIVEVFIDLEKGRHPPRVNNLNWQGGLSAGLCSSCIF